MKTTQSKIISDFVALGRELSSFGQTPASDLIINSALEQNMWFSRHDIIYAIDAIREQMLDGEKLTQWASKYNLEPSKQLNVGIVMAGNLPLVGFADLLYVLMAGHRAFVKYSAKDEVLMIYIVDCLKQINPDICIYPLGDNSPLDAVIATGSDNSNRYFKARFAGLPSLLRASRFSVAILDGTETEEQLKALSDDIFLHYGLGCRNVSHLLVRKGYDFTKLMDILAQRDMPNTHYKNNYTQNKALNLMRGKTFLDGGFFTISQGQPFDSLYISNISYSEYSTMEELTAWLNENKNSLQCVVTNHLEVCDISTNFGSAQSPKLNQYADNKDVMQFLLNEL